jgi:polyisoprenyl-phosphate glycosyltransferase
MKSKSTPSLSVVVPLYNEESGILEFAEQLRAVLSKMRNKYEVIFVNDGSEDNSLEVIKTYNWPEAKVISFVSNAGQVSAVDAGYRESTGDYVIAMDSDLQHPPTMIPELLNKIHSENLDVVYCVRPDRTEESFFKRNAAKFYYKIVRFLSDVPIEDSASEYRIVSKRVIDTVKLLPPGKRMIRLLIASFNFPSGTVPYVAASRFSGTTKYNFRSLLSLAVNSILGFSTKPLKLSIYFGFFVSFLSVLGFAQAIYSYFQTNSIPGWTSMMASIFFLFGVLFIILGVMGAYIGKIMEQLSGRPAYIIDDKNTKL